MHIITSTGVFPLPCPPEFDSGYAVVVIPPKGSFNRRTRKSIDQHEFSYLIIEGDPIDKDQFGFRPSDFDSPTLKWAMNSATLIVVWGGQVPFSPDRFAETLKAYIRPGGRIVIALIRDANHDEWVRFAYEESREGVELFAIKGIPGLPAGAKRQSCPTSGTVH